MSGIIFCCGSATSHFIASEYFVPSLKMWPTSMPRLMRRTPVPVGEGSPSRAVATSRTPATGRSRFTERFEWWRPSSFAPHQTLRAFSIVRST